MEQKLVGWARRVKARVEPPGAGPKLWLFVDRTRVTDPISAISRLPLGLSGIVLRSGSLRSPAELRRIAALCRRRGIAVSIAADAGASPEAWMGRHLRAGRRRAGPRPAFLTSSAHSAAELRAALRAGARVVFLSPVFPTLSHHGAPALGARRWAALARAWPERVAALGGIDGASLRRLPPVCRCIGAIGALIAGRG